MQETQEMWVWSLGQEDPPERLMAAHASILAWRIPWTEEPGRLHSMELQRVRHDWSDLSHSHTHILSAFTPDVQHGSTSSISHRLIQGFYLCSVCHWRLRIWWEMAPSYPINPRFKYQVLLLLKSPLAISIYLGFCHVRRLSSLPLFSPLSPQILIHYLY